MKNSFFARFGLMFGLFGILFLTGCDNHCTHRVQVVREVVEVVREVPQPIRLPPPTVNHDCSPGYRSTRQCGPQLKCVPMPVYRYGRILGTRMVWVPVQTPLPGRYHSGTMFRGY